MCVVQRAAAELLGFACVAALATWPLVLHLASIDRPSDPSQDEYVFYWNYWWMKKALVEQGVNPLFCSQIFYPYGTSLAVTPLTFVFCVLSLPFTIGLAMPAALFFVTKLFIFITYPLAAHGTYRLLLAMGVPRPGALAGALLYAFAPFRMVHLVRLHYLCSFWVPYCLLAFWRVAQELTFRRVLLGGITLALLGMSDLSLLPELLFALAALWITHGIVQRCLWRSAARMAVAGLAGVLLFAPLLVPIVRELHTNPAADVSPRIAVTGEPSDLQLLLSPDVNNLAFLLAPDTHLALLGPDSELARGARFNRQIYGELHAGTGNGAAQAGLGLALIVAVLGLGGIALRERSKWPFGVIALLGAVFALGPYRTWSGHPVTMPFHYLSMILPGLKASRYPATFLRLTNLGLAVLAASGLCRIAPRVRWGALGLALAWLVACMLRPIGFEPIVFEAVHRPIIADPVAGTVLELPPDTEQMRRRSAFGMILHEKPLLGAPITRVRPEALEFFNDTPVCRRLLAPPPPNALDSPRVQREMKENRAVFDRYRLRYIVGRPALFKDDPRLRTDLIAYLRAHDRITVQEFGSFFLARLD
ncbi:MAG: hypothetical protein U1E76_23235 [Planctomycetota bacterium]